MTPMRLSGFIEDTVSAAAPELLTDIRFSTSLSPDATIINTADLKRIIRRQKIPESPETAGKQFLRALKPTFVVNSKLFGRQVVAPYGEATDEIRASTMRNIKLGAILIVVGLIGGGFVLGRSFR